MIFIFLFSSLTSLSKVATVLNLILFPLISTFLSTQVLLLTSIFLHLEVSTLILSSWSAWHLFITLSLSLFTLLFCIVLGSSLFLPCRKLPFCDCFTFSNLLVSTLLSCFVVWSKLNSFCVCRSSCSSTVLCTLFSLRYNFLLARAFNDVFRASGTFFTLLARCQVPLFAVAFVRCLLHCRETIFAVVFVHILCFSPYF